MSSRKNQSYVPPFQLTPTILRLCAEIAGHLGFVTGQNIAVPEPMLRRKNTIRTIHGTLAIEGNSLTVDQMTAVMAGKAVIGSVRHIREVQATEAVYAAAAKWSAVSEPNFLSAHRLMMTDLLQRAGQYRTGGVGIIKGTDIAHVAPGASRVPALMRQLFAWLKAQPQLPAIVTSSVFHYELEFIHPFDDGNGRMGRLWQHIILMSQNPIFKFIPFESEIAKRQEEYYTVLARCDEKADCTEFIEFCATTVALALGEYQQLARPPKVSPIVRLMEARSHFNDSYFSRKDYLLLFKQISTATASRDLNTGIRLKLLRPTGEKRMMRYIFASRLEDKT